MQPVLFSKHLQTTGGLTLSEAADWTARLGFHGVDLTVRDGGYVDPESVMGELPAAVETFEGRGVSVPMITTGIRDADDRAANVFEAADACGVDVLKLGYWTYEGLGTLEAGLDGMEADLSEIGALASGYDVTPAVHVHSGSTLSADGAILADLLADVEGVAAYPDVGHLALEGARSGWKFGLERLIDQAAVIGIKDYGWRSTDDGWDPVSKPLGSGLVDWDEALQFVRESEFDGLLSLHAEYDVPFEALTDRIEADRAYLRERLPPEA